MKGNMDNSSLNISHSEKRNNSAGKTKVMLLALVSVVCLTILCSATFAYFTDNSTSGVSSISSAKYEISVSLVNSEGITEVNGTDVDGNVTYNCTQTGAYTFKITAAGTANSGYCIINVDENSYTTASIGKDDTDAFNITINAESGTVITFKPCWGAYVGETIGSDATIGDIVVSSSQNLTSTDIPAVSTEPIDNVDNSQNQQQDDDRESAVDDNTNQNENEEQATDSDQSQADQNQPNNDDDNTENDENNINDEQSNEPTTEQNKTSESSEADTKAQGSDNMETAQ